MAVLSFLAMLFSLLVADSPTAFWLSFLAFLLCVIVCAVRWDDKKRDGSLPWWW